MGRSWLTTRRGRFSAAALGVAVVSALSVGIALTAASWADKESAKATFTAATFNLEGSVTSSTAGFAESTDSGSPALTLANSGWSRVAPGQSTSATAWLKNTGTSDAILKSAAIKIASATGGLDISDDGGLQVVVAGFSDGDRLAVGAVKAITVTVTGTADLPSAASGDLRIGLTGSSVTSGGQVTSGSWIDTVWFGGKITTATVVSGGLIALNGSTVKTAAWSGMTASAACVTMTVTTTSTTPVTWSVLIDTSAIPWNGATTGYSVNNPNKLGGTLTLNRYLVVTGGTGNATVVSGTNRTVKVCNYQTGIPPVGDSSWYTLKVSAPALNGNQVCRTVTATATGTTAFWFRWTTSVDTTSMFTTLGKRSSYWWIYSDYNVVRDPSSPSTNPSSPSTVSFTSATNDTTSLLNNTKSFAYTLCLNGA